MSGKCVATVLLILLCAGCAKYSEEPVPDEIDQNEASRSTLPSELAESATVNVAHVITSDSVYYVGDPQQMQPPDGTFTSGTKVELIQDAGSYSQVTSEGGIEGYVASDVLKPLTEAE